MAFLRYFPGQTVLEAKPAKDHGHLWADSASNVIKLETRYFTRLTPLATWRSEYLFRTRLMRSLARGKPGVGSGAKQSGKKISAVLTYNSKLPWVVTNIHAIFLNGKKPPRAIHGAADLGVGTLSDPTSGKVEKWGLEDPLGFPQLDEVVPNLVPYGLGEGPAATPNVMDVSQPYGFLAGEGFPGGQAYFRSINESRGRYLGAGTGVVDTCADIPKIPAMSEAICSVWLAKSSAVPLHTQSMVGMLTGSTLGVVTAYALKSDSNGSRYTNGQMTARWVLSPGVPIISLKVDDNFSQKRRTSARVWAVALNALGEVYYLTETPVAIPSGPKSEDATKNAWYAGRSAYWNLLESTRRTARPDDLDKNAVRGTYSPRSPSNSMDLTKHQLAAEAREIEKFLRHKPAHFRKVCEGWDMQRKLEVDFANDDGAGAGESIFVIDCGLGEDRPACVQRFCRVLIPEDASNTKPDEPAAPQPPRSIFGSVELAPNEISKISEPQSPKSPPPTPMPTSGPDTSSHDWLCSTMDLKPLHDVSISASALDCSAYSLLTLTEDPLHAMNAPITSPVTGQGEYSTGEVPGRRSRLFAVGTRDGDVLVWNGRQDAKCQTIRPQRVIHTESPEISCLALSALYLVHGGSDGLVQAWDPLASTAEPIRTLNARSNGRVPRHMLTMNPALRDTNYVAAVAIYLDPDPTVLRGIVSFGAFLRYWAYSSTRHPSGRKRRLRHSDIHGRLASRRTGGNVAGYIAAEEAELRRENEHRAKEQARLRSRFGVGALGDLTEEEALIYAQMVSEETFQVDELRRASDSAPDASLDTASSFSEATIDTATPEPSVTDTTPPTGEVPDMVDEFEQQIQQAIRLSLLEGVNENNDQSSAQVHGGGDYEFAVKYKNKGNNNKKSNKSPSSSSLSAAHTPLVGTNGSSSRPEPRDDDLELAIRLSLQEHGLLEVQDAEPQDEFPPLETEGVGKGKGVQRW